MKKKYLIFIVLIIIIYLSPFNSLNAQVIGIQWNTFIGSINWDRSEGIVSDGAGNIYIAGYCSDTWGSPINAHPGSHSAFVAKLDGNANLVWNTFLGSSNFDYAFDIAIDEPGNIYVTGYSNSTWGTPLNAHAGGDEIFVAKLDNNGNLIWNTFLGSSSGDYGEGIASTNTGTIYVTGASSATWATPIIAYSGGDDAFVAKLDTNGNLLWNTFLGCSSIDYGYSIALDSGENAYVTGKSYGTWGSPINPYTGGCDAFVAKLNSNGTLQWNTFQGCGSTDWGRCISSDSGGSVCITGHSYATWGSPINPYQGNVDAFVARFEPDGTLVWNTFLGSSNDDYGLGITADNAGNVYVTGNSYDSWGNPINPYAGYCDIFVSRINLDGNLSWHTFLGSSEIDEGRGITLYNEDTIYITGRSNASWGNPINPYAGDDDAIIAKIIPYPIPEIKANGSDGPITITQSDTLQIRVSLFSYGLTNDVDFWLAYKTASGWYHFNNSTKSWDPGLGVTHQGILFDLNNKKVFQSSGLSPGAYRFYFGVDLNMDGNLTKSCLYYDEVKVTVTSD